MVEEYQQTVFGGNLGGVKDMPGPYSHLGQKCSPEVYMSCLILSFHFFLDLTCFSLDFKSRENRDHDHLELPNPLDIN